MFDCKEDRPYILDRDEDIIKALNQENARQEIASFLKNINKDETCNKEFYSIEKLRVDYPVDWEHWENFPEYLHNECILLLGGIDPDKESEINKIIWENYTKHEGLCEEYERLCKKLHNSEKWLNYIDSAPQEEKIIYERFYEMKNIYYWCCVEEKKSPPCYLLPCFEEIKKDLSSYNPDKTSLKKDRLKEVVTVLKGKKPGRYKHIPDSFLENDEKTLKRKQDFLVKLGGEIKSKASEQGIELSSSETVECIAICLNICIERKDKNPCYNPDAKVRKNFGLDTVTKSIKKIFPKNKGGRLDNIETKKRKEKIDKLREVLSSSEFDKFRQAMIDENF
jgi:hypothetical protein